MKITGKERTLHFVSYELYFTFLSQLVKGGQTMSAFIKSQKFMNELYFGSEKNPEYRKAMWLKEDFRSKCEYLKPSKRDLRYFLMH
jgi:hypothetical protein